MSFKKFVASVIVDFDASSFKAGLSDAQKAYDKAFRGMSAAVEDFQARGGMAMETATQLSLIASSTEQYRQQIQEVLAAPSEMAKELESALAAASTVVTPELSIDGDYAKTMEALRAQALAWGDGAAEGASVASASAAEYAATTYSMLSAGLQAEAAMNATSQAMILAKGTMGETRDAADLLAMAYNTMGDKAKDSGVELQSMADVVAKTQAAFQIANLNQLSEGLKYAIPTAQRFKIEWAEINTIIGQLNTSGLTGGQAGTSFASMMAQMLKASQSLGFEIAYDEGGGMSVIGTLENIRDKFGAISDLSPAVQMAFDTAFGQEGSRALTLLSTALDSLSAQYDAVADSEGQAEMMAARMSDTYADRTSRMQNAQAAMQARLGESTNAVKGFFADVGTAIYSAAAAFLDTDIGGSVGALASGIGLAAEGLLGFGGTALNVAAQLATFVAMTQQAGGIVALFRAGLGMVGALFSGLGAAAVGFGSTVVAALKAIGTAFYTATGPIGLVIGAIVAAAFAGYQVYKHWDQIKAFFADLWEGVKNIFSAAISWIMNLVSGFINAILAPFRWLKDTISGLFGGKSAEGEIEALDMSADIERLTADNGPSLEAAASAAIPDMTASIEDTVAELTDAASSAVAGAIPTASSDTSWQAVDPASFLSDANLDTSWANVDWQSMAAPGEVGHIAPVDPVVITEESHNVLSDIRALVSDILSEVKDRKPGSIVIEAVNLPKTDDFEDVMCFVKDLREQIGKEIA